MDGMVGQPVDIASSAYEYRADRSPTDNAPESWLALMHAAKLPLNRPVDRKAPTITRVLCSLLWEEIRPIESLELTWPVGAKRVPRPEGLTVTTLDAQGSASSWWNNLAAATHDVTPTVSSDGRTYFYALRRNTCGVVLSVRGPKPARYYAVPQVRALVADTWKKMDLEIEWAFESAKAAKDYSGRMESYDGRLFHLRPLGGDTTTKPGEDLAWKSVGASPGRRGVRASLLYMGTSKWRKVQPFTSQRDDVSRTIVTVRTRSGSFSFLAADLESGPIYAPEYGFFVRRTSASPRQTGPAEPRRLLTSRMDSIAGDSRLIGWGSDATPWAGGNATDQGVTVRGVTIPARSLAMHPGPEEIVGASWRSPIQGTVRTKGTIAHAQAGSTGIDWRIEKQSGSHRAVLASGSTEGMGSREIEIPKSLTVGQGDEISLLIGPKGDHRCDSTLVDLTVLEIGGEGRVWDITQDVAGSIHEGNPHADRLGNKAVWSFAAQPLDPIPSEPPISLESSAASAKAFLKELKARNLTTIRRQIRSHPEQTWESAVSALFGPNVPPHPTPPQGSEPAMQVQVPSARLTAQWNLGIWHLVRHCAKNPKTGKLWFNDFPYGILGAETYMVLHALDLMGSNEAAADGFDQWVSLPMDPNSKGHHEWALPDRPNGLFTEGHGCLTHAVGPDGWGGQMDGVHAFGPGSIGWALTEHYWLTGDKRWLKAAALRIVANAEWMLRQRQVMARALPGGSRLWSKGLQPALQVTPDSGGLWMPFYECEAYYWASLSRLATTLAEVDPVGAKRLRAEADAYRKDLRAAVDRSITLSPVVPIRDGTYHSVIPFGCYVRGLGTGAWGWQRDGSGVHVGPLYWETVQSAAALISPAGLLSASDVRVQGYLDVLEDRLLLENANVAQKAKGQWFDAGWQYQGGLERTPNMHLAADDVPVFLRSFLNCYSVDILANDGYTFNEHAVHGPPDKIFEEAAFLERMRNLLVMEDGPNLWLARATPRAWLAQGKHISVKDAPTHFGTVAYKIVSDVDHGRMMATVSLPSRHPPEAVWLRLRHPHSAPIVSVTVNGKAWTDFDRAKEVVRLHGLRGTVAVSVHYKHAASRG